MHAIVIRVCTLLCSFVLLAVGVFLTPAGNAQPGAPDLLQTIDLTFTGMPQLPAPALFIQNVGQYDDQLLFRGWGGRGGTLWLTEDALQVIVLPEHANGTDDPGPGNGPDKLPERPVSARRSNSLGASLRITFEGANPHPRIEPFNRLATKVSFFLGNDPDRWHPDVPAWGGVRYVDLYPGIDLVLDAGALAGQPALRWEARAGADLSTVQVQVEGAEGLSLQSSNVPVTSKTDGTDETSELLYSMLMGGSAEDSGYTITVDETGSAFVAGFMASGTSVATPGPFDASATDYNAFVAKLDPAGNRIIYATFLGGSFADRAYDIVIDSFGYAYVTGSTRSPDFPTTVGAFDTGHNGGVCRYDGTDQPCADGFMAKLAPTGTSLSYATFIGGGDYDWVTAIALDASGAAYLTGLTLSEDFPTTAGAFDTSYNGAAEWPFMNAWYGDAFVARLDPLGSRLAYATYLGGKSYEARYGDVAVLPTGEAVITGVTGSADFPTTPGAFDTTHNGNADIYVTRLKADGSGLVYSTFMGGSSEEQGDAVVVDGSGAAYIVGWTYSPSFPMTSGALITTYGGKGDGVLFKLDASGRSLIFATYVGGSESDGTYDLVLGQENDLLVTGATRSIDFPTTADAFAPVLHPGICGVEPNTRPCEDAYAIRLSGDGARLLYATFLGGSHDDLAHEIATDLAGDIYLVGDTESANFPTTEGSATYLGQADIFVSKLLPKAPTPTPTATRTPTATPSPTPTPTATPQPDPHEPDDACVQAGTIPITGEIQRRTFHRPGDTDWVWFDAAAGASYVIEANVPPNSPADVMLELYDRCAGLPAASQDYTYSNGVRLMFEAPENGRYYFSLANHAPTVAGPGVIYELSVRRLDAGPTPGAAIIAAGRLSSNDSLQRNIHNVTNAAYRMFLANGYPAERIYYLATDLSLDADDDRQPDVSARLTAANLRAAITQWAMDKVGPDRALTVFFIDHGDANLLYLDKPRGELLAPAELDIWLAELEKARTGVRINLIVEACYSGSFIVPPQHISRPGRMVVTSTGSANRAWASKDGAIFSDYLLAALGQGASLYSSFAASTWAVQQAAPWQTPWLDGDGNRIPNETGDYAAASVRGFAYAGTFPGDRWPPYIAQVEIPKAITGRTASIRADVRDDAAIRRVWAVIYPPSYRPPPPGSELAHDLLPTVMLLDQGSGWYGATYSSFDERGSYRIVVYAEDNIGLEAQPLAVRTAGMVFLPLLVR